MDHAVDLVFGEDALEGRAVVDVGAVEREVLGGLVAHDGADAADDLFGGVGEVVDDNDLVATLEQLDDGVRSDKAGAAGNEDAGVLGIFLLAHAQSFRFDGRKQTSHQYTSRAGARMVRPADRTICQTMPRQKSPISTHLADPQGLGGCKLPRMHD